MSALKGIFMQIVIICLFIAAVLPFLAKGPVAVAMHRLGGYDNKHPRSQQTELTGFGARALAAHQNAFEALLLFATAAITAIASNQVSATVEVASIVFVVARVAYNILYLLNLSTLRSISWAVGTVSCFVILKQCI
ncbi:MAG: putative MAPEG superfamily protein [Phenylobacterium sp.]|jgi:uncharacterized MAPEG superfamily protein